MGISGLLPFLKKSSRNAHVRELKGKTVAIDAYCWLHKGAFSCADKIVKGEKTDAYVTYCMKLVNMLLSHDIKPILVFDGQPLPSKLGTELKRRENRERYKMQAREFLRQGNSAKARECFQKCVDVTSEMALDLIKVCRARNIDCIVAPYEADAQLAFLSIQKIADVIITEDSDLLAFGCHQVLFKMDANGNGVLIERDRLYLSLGGRPENYDEEKFRRMCILAGCDYLPSLPGIGIGKSFKFFSRSTNGDLNSTLCRIPGCLNMPQLEVTTEYRESFVKAELTFLHQLVYDPIQRKLLPLRAYPEELEASTLPYAGEYLKEDVAFQLAIGNLNVETLAKMDDYNPDTAVHKRNNSAIVTKHPSIWSSNFNGRDSSATIAEGTLAMTRETCVKVEFSLTEKTNTSTPLSTDKGTKSKHLDRSRSPVLSARKRKRVDENCTPVSNKSRWSSPAELLKEYGEDYVGAETRPTVDARDIFSDTYELDGASSKVNGPCSPNETPLKRKSPFAKLKPSEDVIGPTMPSPALGSITRKRNVFASQLRKVDADGNEIVASSYFCSESTDFTAQTKKAVLGSEDFVQGSVKEENRSNTDKPFVSPPSKVTKLPASGCRVSGLSKPASRAQSKDGMKQLSLFSMFSRAKE